jgi:hypothetical protein
LIRTNHYVQQSRLDSQETPNFHLESVFQIDKNFIVQQKSYQGLLNPGAHPAALDLTRRLKIPEKELPNLAEDLEMLSPAEEEEIPSLTKGLELLRPTAEDHNLSKLAEDLQVLHPLHPLVEDLEVPRLTAEELLIRNTPPEEPLFPNPPLEELPISIPLLEELPSPNAPPEELPIPGQPRKSTLCLMKFRS